MRVPPTTPLFFSLLSSLLCCLWLFVAPHKAHAQAQYLRTPLHGQSLGAVGGFPEVSVGGWILDRLGASLEFRPLESTIGASMGGRIHLIGGERGWQLDLLLAGSIRYPVTDPSVEAAFIPALSLNARMDKLLFAIQAAFPMSFLFSEPFAYRQSFLLEIWFMGRLGPVWLGIQGNVGPMITATAPVSRLDIAYQGSLVLLYQIDEKR